MVSMHSYKGFTLIELLVVIAIIAVLAAILFPVFARAREKARQSTCTSNQRQLAAAITIYAQDHEETLPDMNTVWKDTSVEPGILTCPSVSKNIGVAYIMNPPCSAKALGTFNDPSSTWLTTDGVDGEYDLRHSNRSIASYIDGHVTPFVPTLSFGSSPGNFQCYVGNYITITALYGLKQTNETSSWKILSFAGPNTWTINPSDHLRDTIDFKPDYSTAFDTGIYNFFAVSARNPLVVGKFSVIMKTIPINTSNGLVAWYDSIGMDGYTNGQAVTNWVDNTGGAALSGAGGAVCWNGANALYRRAIVNAATIANGTFTRTITPPTTALSVVIMMKPNTDMSSQPNWAGIFDNDGLPGANYDLHFRVVSNSGSFWQAYMGDDSVEAPSTSSVNITTWYRLIAIGNVNDTNKTKVNNYVSGTNIGNLSIPYVAGKSFDAKLSTAASANIAEIAVFNRALSDSERQMMDGYLQEKYMQ